MEQTEQTAKTGEVTCNPTIHKPVINSKFDVARTVKLEQRVTDLENQVDWLMEVVKKLKQSC